MTDGFANQRAGHAMLDDVAALAAGSAGTVNATGILCHCGQPATRDGEDLGPICDECGPTPIPCGECGKPTTSDDTYGDLCFRCAFAENH